MRLDLPRAESLARLIAPSLRREYPNQIVLLMRSDRDARPPRELSPMFHGCFDWHSAVHSHWALVRLARLFPSASWAGDVRAALAESFTAERAAGELAHLTDRPGFELPYGMAWLLQLDAELAEADRDTELTEWRAVLAPLAGLACRRIGSWLEILPCAIRSGEHSQSALAMGLALDWARATGNARLADLIAERARRFYLADRDAPLAYEPSAFDFLSPALAEADLMRRVLAGPELGTWLAGFLPEGARWQPVVPADRGDGKLVHFDGLNLSRAWMMRGIALALPDGVRRAALLAAAAEHESAGLEGVDGRHYAGGHWLGSFAVYLLSDRGTGQR
jgi:Protein of unknown function (DUF2891)